MNEYLQDAQAKQDKISELPLFTAVIEDPEYELQGWVSIHSLGSDGSCGGGPGR